VARSLVQGVGRMLDPFLRPAPRLGCAVQSDGLAAAKYVFVYVVHLCAAALQQPCVCRVAVSCYGHGRQYRGETRRKTSAV
jgi:hypothetical protein